MYYEHVHEVTDKFWSELALAPTLLTNLNYLIPSWAKEIFEIETKIGEQHNFCRKPTGALHLILLRVLELTILDLAI